MYMENKFLEISKNKSNFYVNGYTPWVKHKLRYVSIEIVENTVLHIEIYFLQSKTMIKLLITF